MTLTRKQLEENIEALDSQGASQTEIQEYINSQQIQPEQPTPTQSKSFFRPIELGASILETAKEEFGNRNTGTIRWSWHSNRCQR